MAECKDMGGPPKKKRKFQDTWTKEFHWLEYESTNNAMFCTICKKAKKKNTFTTGCRDFQKSALSKHVTTAVHKAAQDDLKSSSAFFKSVQNAEVNAEDSLTKQLRTVHYMARENLPLVKYEGLVNLQKLNGAPFSGVYYHHQQVLRYCI